MNEFTSVYLYGVHLNIYYGACKTVNISMSIIGKWEIPDYIDIDSFDFDWQPNLYDPPYIHQFGTRADKGNGPRLVVNGATDIKYHDFPIATHKNESGKWEVPLGLETANFDFDWRPSDHEPLYIHQFGTTLDSQCGPRLIVKDAVLTKYHISDASKWTPLDIIFVSNGETGEQRRYDRLVQVAGRKVEWVRGVQGRENALRRAAELSSTEWFFCFPGKLYADYNFDFNFQPNRSYDPKHYIFYAQNPLNGLVYGHQAAVCYNRQLVLETIDYGLDFTMSKPHDIMPVISGVAEYNSDALMTWRTAFREAIKLSLDNSAESKDRLDTWRSYARGPYAEWSLIGAEDGILYAESVWNLPSELMKSFEWSWLNKLFEAKYPHYRDLLSRR